MSNSPQSWYQASAHPTPAAPRLDGDARVDVVVIGGGFTGISSALALAEAGRSVLLLEAETIGAGASGRNGGQLIAGLRWDASALVDRFGMAQGKALFDLAVTALDRVRARITRHDINCDYRPGQFYAAARPDHVPKMAKEVAFLHNVMGYDHVKLIARDDVHRIVNADGYYGGIMDRNGGHFHPLNYLIGLAHAADAAGVRLHQHSPARNIQQQGDKVIVTTDHGIVTADHAVLGCDSGMGSIRPDLAHFAMAVMNYNIATEPLGEDRARSLIPANAAIADSRFVLNYYRLSADHRLIFGGGEKYSPRPPKDIPGFVRPHMTRVFPSLENIGIDFGWGGAVGVSLNRLPVMGREGNIFYAHGYSGQGAALTTLAGELMAEAIASGSTGFDLFAQLPHRPFPGGRLLRHPLYVLGMLYYALRDRI